MLLTITTTHQPATDLGHLLRKHPGKTQAFEQSFGGAHVFYPEASDLVCTAALLLSFFATLYPAWRAARTQPAEALRYE